MFKINIKYFESKLKSFIKVKKLNNKDKLIIAICIFLIFISPIIYFKISNNFGLYSKKQLSEISDYSISQNYSKNTALDGWDFLGLDVSKKYKFGKALIINGKFLQKKIIGFSTVKPINKNSVIVIGQTGGKRTSYKNTYAEKNNYIVNNNGYIQLPIKIYDGISWYDSAGIKNRLIVKNKNVVNIFLGEEGNSSGMLQYEKGIGMTLLRTYYLADKSTLAVMDMFIAEIKYPGSRSWKKYNPQKKGSMKLTAPFF